MKILSISNIGTKNTENQNLNVVRKYDGWLNIFGKLYCNTKILQVIIHYLLQYIIVNNNEMWGVIF